MVIPIPTQALADFYHARKTMRPFSMSGHDNEALLT